MISSKSVSKLLLLCFFFIPSFGYAQSLNQGLTYYKQKKYQQALPVFNQIKEPRGYLFTAKTQYALGQYGQAQANLNNISKNAPARIIAEAKYTTALVQFQLKHFAESLSSLNSVMLQNENDAGLKRDADHVYQQILHYLTARQRQEAIQKMSSDAVRFDLFKSALGRISFAQAIEVYKTFQSEASEKKWKNKAHKLKSTFKSVSSYHQRYGSSASLSPPDGTIYTLGAALPKYKQNNRTYEIVQGLYFGAMIAVQNFNRHHQKVRAKLQFVDTGTSNDGLKSAVQMFSQQQQGDILIGPLFSKQAKAMVGIANHAKVPCIAPLANANIDATNSYMFQANPTFAMHGKQMAKYAINHLHISDFTILVDQQGKGSISAASFRDEVGRLGGNIDHFFRKNYQSNNVQLQKSLQKMLIDQTSTDAIYAPFTGRNSLKMIDYMVSDLQQMNKKTILLGSQEFQNVNYRDPKYHAYTFYFTDGSYQENNSRDLLRFKHSYERKFGHAGNHYSLIGYDLATFILQTMAKVGNPALLEKALSQQPLFRGLVQNIRFNEQHVNEAVKILKAGSGHNPSVVH